MYERENAFVFLPVIAQQVQVAEVKRLTINVRNIPETDTIFVTQITDQLRANILIINSKPIPPPT